MGSASTILTGPVHLALAAIPTELGKIVRLRTLLKVNQQPILGVA
tara:strand:+ start:9737 stop:9871 length:135 start_codon:yes stop_codon:yes gene_type:complete